jgi:hypothetical protein
MPPEFVPAPELLAAMPEQSVRGAWGIFALLTVTLVLLILVALVTMLRRRLPRRRERERTDARAPDAWTEAGRRAQAYRTEDD